MLESVSKSFGEKQVLSNFSLALPRQGVVALMGPSGCGKTTLLRLLMGLEQPDGGKVCLPQGARLSAVFQEDRLLPALTARNNLLAVLDGERYGKADRWLDRMGLGDAANLYPGEMSGGMRRRLAIARAMAFGGDFLVLDEPFKELDSRTKAGVMDAVFQARGGGLTLLVTHDPGEAQLAGRIIALEGPPLRVVADTAE